MAVMTTFKADIDLTSDPIGTSLSARAAELRDLFGVDPVPPIGWYDSVGVPTDRLVLVTGPSGIGKSSVLRDIRATAGAAGIEDLPEPGPDDRVIDLFDDDVRETMSWLGRFGIGEPHLLLAHPDELSDGQTHRLQLARLTRLDAPLIVVDEFCSNLDRVTAHVFAFNFQRACRSMGISAVVATAHDDLHLILQPDVHLHLEADGRHRRECSCTEPVRSIDECLPVALIEEAGSRDDFERLAMIHDHTDDDHVIDWDQLVVEVRRIRFDGMVVAVKVFGRAFPPALEVVPLLASINARVLFQERVIVHPAFRGMSLNARMWPTIGDQPLLFSQSPLGLVFPFLLRAGYRRIPHPSEHPAPEQLDLEDALRLLDPLVDVHSGAALIRLFAGISSNQVDVIRAAVAEAFVALSVRHVRFLAELIAQDAPDDQLDVIAGACRAAVAETNDVELAHLAVSSVPFPMAGFVRARPRLPAPRDPGGQR